ncbi:helix-turn-helix domain-containing protein [Escherichia coli]|uniref:helix-turn-helix domain-containing protein n=1 Tax=Escherichia coli TaxID=562 RepID=UPI000D0FFFC2|nr:helix-turn-helix transcriptional regulator [Escherichia coli]HBN1732855.1 helix-turn-helix transcriptional regulator [Escherichia coli]HDP9855835.1 helix-turn-helix transcriptional regulator [Escherichia coli]
MLRFVHLSTENKYLYKVKIIYMTQKKFHIEQGEPEKKHSGVGRRCRERREELKLSRNNVAHQVNVSISTLQAWENGEREPNASDLLRLAQALQVDPAWILLGEWRQANEIAEDEPHRPLQSSESENVTSPGILETLLGRVSKQDKDKLIDALCEIGIKGVLERLQQPTRQTKQADSDLDEQETAIRSLNIRESLKDAICMALAGNEETDKEILRRIESRARAGSPGGQTVATPEQETKPVSKKLT